MILYCENKNKIILLENISPFTVVPVTKGIKIKTIIRTRPSQEP